MTGDGQQVADVAERGHLGNRFGLGEALLGLAVGFLISLLAVSAYASADHLPVSTTSTTETILSLFGLWSGLVGGAVVATRLHAGAKGGSGGTGSVVSDYGFHLTWWDVPLGAAVGVACQFLLVPLLELPLLPFVPHLTERLGHPTRQLLGPATSSGTAGLVVVAVLVCLGSPIVEELFFRGLLFRSLLGRLAPLGRRGGPILSVVLTGIVFGLVHFESLEFLALAGFGMVLAALAWRTGRLGASIVAHVAFNTSTVVAYVLAH